MNYISPERATSTGYEAMRRRYHNTVIQDINLTSMSGQRQEWADFDLEQV